MILLDTDHMTIIGYPESVRGKELLAKLVESGDDDVGTTIVTAEEQLRGWLASIARERRVHRQVMGYRQLRAQLVRLASWTIVPFDDGAADQFEEFRRSGVRRIIMAVLLPFMNGTKGRRTG